VYSPERRVAALPMLLFKNNHRNKILDRALRAVGSRVPSMFFARLGRLTVFFMSFDVPNSGWEGVGSYVNVVRMMILLLMIAMKIVIVMRRRRRMG